MEQNKTKTSSFLQKKKQVAKSFFMQAVKTKTHGTRWHITISILSVFAVVATSCKKLETGYLSNKTIVHRTVSFSLYTDRDLSKDQANISFTLFIRNTSNTPLWDSALAPMKLKDIPRAANRILVQKSVPDNEQSLLKAGFRYSIEGVGDSWYFDSVNVGQVLKVVEFNFK